MSALHVTCGDHAALLLKRLDRAKAPRSPRITATVAPARGPGA
ncbi:hypothetical protein [Fundidesulfovibrio magnetotacticus]|nr:hypothetical protein [Fundidesulfovibrio magnetotacticus]